MPWYTYRLSQLEASWGSLEFIHCELNFTMQELRNRNKESRPPNFKTGGLGPLMQPDLYEVWVCIEDHYCSNHPTDRFFCWVLDETKAQNGEVVPDQYVAWNHNANLQIVERLEVVETNSRKKDKNLATSETDKHKKNKQIKRGVDTSAASGVPVATATPPSTKTTRSKLAELKGLFEDGLIDKDVFQEEQKAILAENRK